MAIVTREYYNDIYMGDPIAEDDFARYERRAETLILYLIRKTESEVSALIPSTYMAVENAICAEMEYLYEYGMGVATYGKEGGGGFTVGKVSVKDGGSESGAKTMIAPAVYIYLEQTGLLNANVPTAAEPWMWGWF